MGKVIAVAVRMKSEAELILKKTEIEKHEIVYGFEIYSGKICGKEAVLGISGVGMINMANLAMLLCMRYDVAFMLNYGVVGGYGESIHKGDIIAVTDAVHINSYRAEHAGKGEGISLDRNRLITFSEGLTDGIVKYKSDGEILEKAKSIFGDRLIFGTIGSGDVWNREYDKIMLFNTKYGVCGEDMECYRMYRSADRFAVPCMSIKGVSNNEILKEEYDYSVMKTLADCVYEFIEKI